MANKTLITNAQIVGAPSLAPYTVGWMLIDGERIEAIGAGTPEATMQADATIVDAAGAVAMPGLIDTHVHFREPGLTHKGDIATESRAAVLGGITSYIEMPNTNPATTTAEAFADKMKRAAGRSFGNYGFMLGASDGVMDAIAKIPANELPSIKLFMGTTTGGMAMPPADQLDTMLRFCAEKKIPVVVHAEDNDIIAANAAAAVARYGSKDSVPVSEHHRIRSVEACTSCTRRAIDMAREYGLRLHIAHLRTAEEAAEIAKARKEVPGLTAETTPMYLCVDKSPEFTTTWRIKINPAVKGYVPELGKALKDGTIDTIATDHAPHLREEKQGGALTAASGAPSVQFALLMLLTEFSPELIARKMAFAPAKLFGIENRGSIAPGNFADIVITEKCPVHTITDADVKAPCAWTPFDGRTVNHRVAHVWVNGRHTVNNGEICGEAAGEALIFNR